jgi:hypothetical protein
MLQWTSARMLVAIATWAPILLAGEFTINPAHWWSISVSRSDTYTVRGKATLSGAAQAGSRSRVIFLAA